MTPHFDYGPDGDEETRLKEQLRQLHEEYKKRAQPIIDQLVLLRNLRTPKISIEVTPAPGKVMYAKAGFMAPFAHLTDEQQEAIHRAAFERVQREREPKK